MGRQYKNVVVDSDFGPSPVDFGFDPRFLSSLIEELSQTPHVVATVTTASDLALLTPEVKTAADILEFRLDDLADSLPQVNRTIESISTPSLITVRRPEEGGTCDLSEEKRLALYRAAMPGAQLVDTEIASLGTSGFAGFAEEVHSAGALLVGSFHDFNGFPGTDILDREVKKAFECGADIAKVAVVIEHLSDLFQLAELIGEVLAADLRISAMGMGPYGKLSRLVLAKAGSCLNYGYLQTPNAPGQWPAAELKRLIEEI